MFSFAEKLTSRHLLEGIVPPLTEDRETLIKGVLGLLETQAGKFQQTAKSDPVAEPDAPRANTRAAVPTQSEPAPKQSGAIDKKRKLAVAESLARLFNRKVEEVAELVGLTEAKLWIAQATKNKGALRTKLGVSKKTGKIPANKLQKAAKKGGKLGKQARLALLLARFKKK